ncbi:MAG TPA: phosphoenolpyruvate carboxylase [Steroidobacteraceae bacterium]|nr:phosphoenolpyruvate carboxylase [Steroidobacteraceae bacterium]
MASRIRGESILKRQQIHFPPKHEALREDVHALGDLIGSVLREQGGVALLATVEEDRVTAINRREGDATAGSELAARVRGRLPAQARDLVRAFSAWFQVVNLAESVHRIRRRRDYFLKDSGRPQPGGIEDALGTLKAAGSTLDDILAILPQLQIQPVFTAHPTEATRRTMLRKQQRVAQLLLDRLDPTLTPRESRAVWNRVRAEITTAWQTEDHPRERLTVADEREHVLFYLGEVLYRVVPDFYEEVAEALEKLYGIEAEALQLPRILGFGTWVGGDMDGNPDVNGKTIRETLDRQNRVILSAYFEECQTLAQELSQSASRVSISAGLAKRIEHYNTLVPGSRSITPARHDRMPYRVFLAQCGTRLRNSLEGRPNGYEHAQEFEGDIRLIADSLRANKGWNAGHHSVQRLLRRVQTFGFHMATLDVRQHTSVHHQVLAQGLGDPRWLERTAQQRAELLSGALARDQGPRMELDPQGRRSRGVFEAMVQARHRYGPDAIGYYVVSGVQGIDDVLAVLLLARWAEAWDKRSGEAAVDVAPMFECLDTLERGADLMRQLLADPTYQRHLAARLGRQGVVLGHADISKEGGICNARVAIYHAQAALNEALKGVVAHPVIMHARGGSIALGGGRIDTLVRAAPAGATNPVLRITEQGQVVNQSYGLRPIAMRTLERAFSALALSVGQARRGALVAVAPVHEACAATLAQASAAAYRRLVVGEPDFQDYFRQVTPIDVIERMQIGSRAAYRSAATTIDSVRAVPWVFAWIQSRHLLPGWFGAGHGLGAAIEAHGLAAVQSAYTQWQFLRTLIDDIEAMLARADLEIAFAYEELVDEPLHRHFDAIRTEYETARQHVLAVKGYAALLDGEPQLQRSIQLRNPYVDPMNLMQVDLLRRWRATGREDRDLFEALLASISGIAQGLQSTG